MRISDGSSDVCSSDLQYRAQFISRRKDTDRHAPFKPGSGRFRNSRELLLKGRTSHRNAEQSHNFELIPVGYPFRAKKRNRATTSPCKSGATIQICREKNIGVRPQWPTRVRDDTRKAKNRS